MNELHTDMGCYETKQFIRHHLEQAADSFIAIGYGLKHMRDGELYREEGYESIWAFAAVEFGISKSVASRFMSINDRFSLGGNSEKVDPKYKGFSRSQLQEMLYLTDEQLEQATPEMKVQDIRSMRQPKEDPYFEIDGQLDLETDFPEVIPEAPATIQQTALRTTLEETVGEDEPEETQEEEPEVVATSQQHEETESQDAANRQQNISAKQQSGKHLQDPILEYAQPEEAELDPIEYDRNTLKNMIEDTKNALDLMRDHWIKEQPYTYARYSMRIQAYEMLLRVHDEADQEPTEQPELPQMKNNDQRKEWLRDYKPWGVWYTDKHTGSTFYKYDFECGARLVVEEFTSKHYRGVFTSANYHLVGGPEAPNGSCGIGKWTRHEEYNHYPNNETELVEFLKYIQRGV